MADVKESISVDYNKNLLKTLKMVI